MRLIDADKMKADETGAFIITQVKITDTTTRLVNEVVHKKVQMLIDDTDSVDTFHSNGICEYCKDEHTCEMKRKGTKGCKFFGGKTVAEVDECE